MEEEERPGSVSGPIFKKNQKISIQDYESAQPQPVQQQQQQQLLPLHADGARVFDDYCTAFLAANEEAPFYTRMQVISDLVRIKLKPESMSFGKAVSQLVGASEFYKEFYSLGHSLEPCLRHQQLTADQVKEFVILMHRLVDDVTHTVKQKQVECGLTGVAKWLLEWFSSAIHSEYEQHSAQPQEYHPPAHTGAVPEGDGPWDNIHPMLALLEVYQAYTDVEVFTETVVQTSAPQLLLELIGGSYPFQIRGVALCVVADIIQKQPFSFFINFELAKKLEGFLWGPQHITDHNCQVSAAVLVRRCVCDVTKEQLVYTGKDESPDIDPDDIMNRVLFRDQRLHNLALVLDHGFVEKMLHWLPHYNEKPSVYTEWVRAVGEIVRAVNAVESEWAIGSLHDLQSGLQTMTQSIGAILNEPVAEVRPHTSFLKQKRVEKSAAMTPPMTPENKLRLVQEELMGMRNSSHLDSPVYRDIELETAAIMWTCDCVASLVHCPKVENVHLCDYNVIGTLALLLSTEGDAAFRDLPPPLPYVMNGLIQQKGIGMVDPYRQDGGDLKLAPNQDSSFIGCISHTIGRALYTLLAHFEQQQSQKYFHKVVECICLVGLPRMLRHLSFDYADVDNTLLWERIVSFLVKAPMSTIELTAICFSLGKLITEICEPIAKAHKGLLTGEIQLEVNEGDHRPLSGRWNDTGIITVYKLGSGHPALPRALDILYTLFIGDQLLSTPVRDALLTSIDVSSLDDYLQLTSTKTQQWGLLLNMLHELSAIKKPEYLKLMSNKIQLWWKKILYNKTSYFMSNKVLVLFTIATDEKSDLFVEQVQLHRKLWNDWFQRWFPGRKRKQPVRATSDFAKKSDYEIYIPPPTALIDVVQQKYT